MHWFESTRLRLTIAPLAVAVVVVIALPVASAHAATRMPVGFYDDPSFRWSPVATQNFVSAQKTGATVVHTLADWSQLAPTKPKQPLNGNDPAYQLADLDQFVQNAAAHGMQVLVTITGTPRWANGGRMPNYAPKSMTTLTQFAHMLAARYNGKNGFGTVTRWSIWNEPNLGRFLAPQYRGKTIVSGATYARLYLAGYRGIKAGNRFAQVAAGETSNRGRNKPTGSVGNDTVAPALFAQLVAKANPHLQFSAWATHPYPSEYRLGPGQKVAYPNVALSTMSRFGADLKKWFHRAVPIWITEYGEQTKPEDKFGGITYARQAADIKKAMRLAQANPYVQMFIWFIFRDSTSATWASGIEKRTGAKKPGYAAFAATAKAIDGQTQTLTKDRAMSVKVAVPLFSSIDAPGTPIQLSYRLMVGSRLAKSGTVTAKLAADQTVTLKLTRPAAKARYTLAVTATDDSGQTAKRTVALVP
jgi:cellulase (glycosyl hydrolase family 5)